MKPDINQGVKLFLKKGPQFQGWRVHFVNITNYASLWAMELDVRAIFVWSWKLVSLSVLSANGWKDQNMDSSFCPQGKP